MVNTKLWQCRDPLSDAKVCVCVSVCAFPHSFVCFVSHLSLETLVEVGLSTGCQTNLI